MEWFQQSQRWKRSQPPDRREQESSDATGVRRPPAARRPDVPGGRMPADADHRQRPVAPERGNAIDEALRGQPAPGVRPAAELPPVPERGRGVVEEAEAGKPQPAVRPRGRPQAVGAEQPAVLPDRPGEGPVPRSGLLPNTDEPDNSTGYMNQRRGSCSEGNCSWPKSDWVFSIQDIASFNIRKCKSSLPFATSSGEVERPSKRNVGSLGLILQRRADCSSTRRADRVQDEPFRPSSG